MAPDSRYGITIELPGGPNGNTSAGANRFARMKEKKLWYEAVWREVARLGPPAEPLGKAWIHITRHSSGRCDYDNLVQCGKFLIDALSSKQGGSVIIDDSPAHILATYDHVKAPPKAMHTTIEVLEVDILPVRSLLWHDSESPGDDAA